MAADTFNGAGEDFGGLEDDEDESLGPIEGSPIPDDDYNADTGGDTGGDADGDEATFDDPVPDDSDAADPNTLLHMVEKDSDFSDDEFESPRQPGQPAHTPERHHADVQTDDYGTEGQTQDDGSISFDDDGQGAAADTTDDTQGNDMQDGAATQEQAAWPVNGGQQPMYPPVIQPGQQFGQMPQYYQQQEPPVQQGDGMAQWPPQTGQQGYYQQQPTSYPQQYADQQVQQQDGYVQDDGDGYDARQDQPQTEGYGEYAQGDQSDVQGDQYAESDTADDDNLPSVSKSIPDADMIARIISLGDSVRQDMDKDERSALRKVLDVSEPEYGTGGKQDEDAVDTANIVFSSLRVRKSMLEAFDELLNAQEKDPKGMAFYLIRQEDQDLRNIIGICRKFVDDDDRPDKSYIHVSLAEIAANCISSLDDKDVQLLQSVRKTLEIARGVVHG